MPSKQGGPARIDTVYAQLWLSNNLVVDYLEANFPPEQICCRLVSHLLSAEYMHTEIIYYFFISILLYNSKNHAFYRIIASLNNRTEAGLPPASLK